jgi:dGTPase
MKDHGGFEGNAQSLRIITETAWSVSPGNKPTRTGIEPTRAAVESILKYRDLHSCKQDPPETRSKFLYDYQHELLERLSVPNSRPVECQIMDIADDVGNALMDFADGVRAGIITEDAINKQQAENDVDNTWIQRKITDSLQPNYINRDVAKWIGECVRSLQIEPNECTSRNSYKYNISLGERETAFMTTLRNINRALLFSDREIQASDNSGAFIIKVLFEAFLRHYCEAPSNRLRDEKIIPEDWHQRLNEAEEKDRYRLIADFISGMTDDYAKLIFDMLIETGLTH